MGADYDAVAQLWIQAAAVLIAGGWSAIGSTFCFWLTGKLVPLRTDRDSEREGLDLTDHGERAYNY
jgi:Amt family ammonium transporter